MAILARVPATIANLGPGFDALALALDLWNEVRVDVEGEPGIDIEGEGADELPTDQGNLVAEAMAVIAGASGTTLPPLRLTCTNRIPLERGLGSSASAVVAGVLVADRILGTGLDPDELLTFAVGIEGHADNVAAGLRGGAVVAYPSADGWQAASFSPHPALRPVVLVPEQERLSTTEARRALPDDVPFRDAAFNAGRAALAVLALTERPDLLGDALEDRLHQDRRLPLMPRTRALFDDLRERGVPVCVAGAGPSLLAFEDDAHPVADPGSGWRALRLQTAPRGAEVRDDD